jgi:hypothetical protein
MVDEKTRRCLVVKKFYSNHLWQAFDVKHKQQTMYMGGME